MLLLSRNLRSRQRQLLLSIIATSFVCGIDASLLINAAAPDSGTLSPSTQQHKVGDNNELTLRPARPFDDVSSNTESDNTRSKTLPFRKPAIKQTGPVAASSVTKVPAKTVSNRTPQAAAASNAPAPSAPAVGPAAPTLAAPTPVPAATHRSFNEGWVARDAVNINQPLRDPEDRRDPSSIDTSNPADTSFGPAKTVTPTPSYLGDRPTDNQPEVNAPASKPTTAAAQTARTRPTLVLPKDRQPLLPPAQKLLDSKANATPLAKPVEPKVTTSIAKPPIEAKPAQEASKDVALGASENEETPAKVDSRVERILETLMPADGTVTHSIENPKSKTIESKSAPSASNPSDLELELRSPSETKSVETIPNKASSQIASSTANEAASDVIVRKLRIDADGSIAGKKPATIHSSSPSQSASPSKSIADDAASSYLGDINPNEPEIVSPRFVSDVSLDYIGMPTSPRQASNQVRRLQGGMSHVLNYFYQRPEEADERSNWGMLHAIMVYGTDTRVRAGNKTHSAIAWMAGNNFCRGQQLAEATEEGIQIKSGVGLQGHQGQMLAIFSLCGVPSEYPIYASGKKFSINDVIQAEMQACKSGEELTFTLIALSHYLDSDASWIADDGETWSIERLIEEELSQPIVGAACGGTHRLMGFSHALRNRRLQGKPITGQWARAEKFTVDFVRYTYQLQNRDGSMSTNWFEGREDNGDLDRKIQTTGHIVEWLLSVTPDSELENPRLVQAIRFLLNSFYNDLEYDWSIGPKGHALRSLAIYHQRVFGSAPWKTGAVAQRAGKSLTR